MSEDKVIAKEMQRVLCPLCKMLVDESEAYTAYRRSSDYQQKKYPEWAYASNLPDHIINFHRLPPKLAGFFVTGLAVSEFLKEHPQFEVKIIGAERS
jgi:hypothetical protein